MKADSLQGISNAAHWALQRHRSSKSNLSPHQLRNIKKRIDFSKSSCFIPESSDPWCKKSAQTRGVHPHLSADSATSMAPQDILQLLQSVANITRILDKYTKENQIREVEECEITILEPEWKLSMSRWENCAVTIVTYFILSFVGNVGQWDFNSLILNGYTFIILLFFLYIYLSKVSHKVR